MAEQLVLRTQMIEGPIDELDFDPYPAAYMFDGRYSEASRLVLETIVVCCVCGRPINPETEREFEACESLGVHLGACWLWLKQDLGS